MIDLDFLHPYPRYGVAAALVEQRMGLADLTDWLGVAELAWKAIDRCLGRYTLFTNDNPTQETTREMQFEFLDEKTLNPGGKNNQGAAWGYYLAPYVITIDKSAAATVAEARAIRELLRKATTVKELLQPQKLKRSIAPVAKEINNGTPSMSEPGASLIETAFTLITTLTEHKPAAQVAVGKGMANTTIIPDLPLVEGAFTPLIDFVQLFADLRVRKQDYDLKNDDLLRVAVPKDRKYRRPLLFRGNYPNAPRDGALGAVSLVAAIGAWARENGSITYLKTDGLTATVAKREFAERILTLLAERPLYVLSYEAVRQEKYGHHLVGLALNANLPGLVRAASRSLPFGVDKIDDPKYTLYKRFFDRFLQRFNRATFRDFMATRTEYASELAPIFIQYMEHEHHLPPSLIASARAYGRSLNYAAYKTAEAEQKDDQKNNRRERPLSEYKNRILVQFESTILSAKTPTALLSQMGIIVGRLTGREIDGEAAEFMETAAGWPDTKLSLAQELITAFMRLSSFQPRVKTIPDAGNVPDEQPANEADDPALDPEPQ
jgi:hypothetical protein